LRTKNPFSKPVRAKTQIAVNASGLGVVGIFEKPPPTNQSSKAILKLKLKTKSLIEILPPELLMKSELQPKFPTFSPNNAKPIVGCSSVLPLKAAYRK